MKIIVAGGIAALLAFILVGPMIYFITADAQAGFNLAFLAAIGVGAVVALAVKKKQEEELRTLANYKRVYSYDMETVFKKMQLRMELAIQGPKFWTPKLVEMSEGWMIYTYTTKKPVLTSIEDTLSLMVAKARDVSESLEEPKTEVIMHFWTNYQMLDPGEIIAQAKWLVGGFDTALPKHEKLQMTDEDLMQLKTLLPNPAS